MTEVKLSDDQAETVYALAHDAYEHGQYAKAATIFSGLAATKRDNPKYWAGLGASQQMLKKYDKASQAYLFAAALDPKDPDHYLRAAECLWHQTKVDEALFTLESAESIANNDKKKHKKLLDQVALYRKAWSNPKRKPEKK